MREAAIARRYKLNNIEDLAGILASELEPINIVSEAPIFTKPLISPEKKAIAG